MGEWVMGTIIGDNIGTTILLMDKILHDPL